MNVIDQMPRETAVALLASNQKMSGTFRRTCMRATWRIVELATSPPNTYGQRLVRRLRSRNAKQLHTWANRNARRGNRLQDLLFDEIDARAISQLKNFIEQVDTIGQAIKTELDRRVNGGRIIT